MEEELKGGEQKDFKDPNNKKRMNWGTVYMVRVILIFISIILIPLSLANIKDSLNVVLFILGFIILIFAIFGKRSLRRIPL